jgi:hypothetical protein
MHIPSNAAARAAAGKCRNLLMNNARLVALLNMAGAGAETACWFQWSDLPLWCDHDDGV